MSINIDKLKDDLKNNPVFNMSLSGKEIFHSNVLAWLLSETNDNDEATSTAKALTKLFPPKDLKADEKAEEKYRVLTVFREKNDFDLLIIYLPETDYKQFLEERRNAEIAINIEDAIDEIKIDSKDASKVESQLKYLKKCKFVVVENKFKAIPDASQLNRYYFRVCGWKKNKNDIWKNDGIINLIKLSRHKDLSLSINESNTTCYLLAPQKAIELFADNPDCSLKEYKNQNNNETGSSLNVIWNLITYDDVLKAIQKNMGKIDKPILDNYIDFTSKMLELSTEAVALNKNTKLYAFEETVNNLRSIRIHDFYEKLWFSAVMSIIRNDLLREIKEGLITDVGYSNGMGMLNFMYTFEKFPAARFGIEIQAKQLRIAVYITDKKNYEWERKEGSTSENPEKEQFEEIFKWLCSIYEKINQDNSESFDYSKEEELELLKFADFKYIKIPLKVENLTVDILGKKIQEVLSIMKLSVEKFLGHTKHK